MLGPVLVKLAPYSGHCTGKRGLNGELGGMNVLFEVVNAHDSQIPARSIPVHCDALNLPKCAL